MRLQSIEVYYVLIYVCVRAILGTTTLFGSFFYCFVKSNTANRCDDMYTMKPVYGTITLF